MSTGSFFSYCNSVKTPVFLVECNNPSQNKQFRDTIDNFHSYVKYKDMPTRNIRWLVYESVSGNLVGAVGLSSATIAVAARDKHIGWTNVQRMKKLCNLANNSRFCLIQKNCTISNVGSQTLKQLRIDGAKRWKEKYGDDLILLETFVQPDRVKKFNGHKTRSGAVYRADNWIEVGNTAGHHIRKTPLKLWAKEKGERGRLAREDKEECLKRYGGYLGEGMTTNGYQITKSPIKTMFIKPLVSDWKERLMA
jgi:hypothetical protein